MSKNWKVPVKSNKELIELAFTQIEKETGLHIIDKMYGNSYFFFDDEDDSICHFRVKEIPGFLFAFWNTCRFDKIEDQLNADRILWCDSLEISSKSELVFFTQFERDLDKFKPSRSGFVTGIYRNEYIKEPDPNEEEIEPFYMHDLIYILQYMRRHPFKSYVYAGCQISKVWEEINGIKCLNIYIRDYISDKKFNFKSTMKQMKYIRVARRLIKKLPDFNSIIVAEDHGIYKNVRIHLRRKQNIDLDKYEQQVDIIEEYEDKYFNKINFECWEVYCGERYTEEMIKEDKKLKNRFFKLVKKYESNNQDNNEQLIQIQIVDRKEGK